MNSQFFSGDTTTQTTGTTSEESIRKLHNNYLFDKALGKDVSSYPESVKKFEELRKNEKSHSIEPLLELETDTTPEEISEPDIQVVPPKEI